ncbi:MAG: hypothetical protein IKK31_03745, partial [Campylobacter sp.]|nr:hypothetical protein [Campylobacter sp.]
AIQDAKGVFTDDDKALLESAIASKKLYRIYGNLISLLTTMKSLPLAYNKDMQEDKECVFDSVKNAKNSLIILNAMIEEIKFNKENMLKATKIGHLSATDLADYLVKQKQIPFRQAHFITGKCVALAESLSKDLSELSLNELQSVEPNISADVLELLTLESSKEARKSLGGTSDYSVDIQLELIDKFIKSQEI